MPSARANSTAVLSCARVDLLTVGEGFDDLIFGGLHRLPAPGEELRAPAFATCAGGGAVITAVAAARLGLTVAALTAVGREPAAALRHERVGLINLLRPGERGAVSVALSTPRDRSFVTFDGVNTSLEPRLLRALGTRLRRRVTHVHFALSPRRSRAWLPVVKRLRDRGTTTSWDFGWNERLPDDPAFPALVDAVDWLFLNEQEARLYSGARSRRAAETHWMQRSGGTVIKRGAEGAVLLYPGGTLRHRGARAAVIDTTGAGDAFNGGFLAVLARRGRAVDALDVAAFVGARATEALGGIDALPRLDQLPRALRRRVSGR